FNNRNKFVEDKPYSGHFHKATTSKTIAKVEKLVIENPYTTTRELFDLTSISQAQITNILTNELGMYKVCKVGATCPL
ncbi:38085_t:CDS:1, partial [Gigaspora margarita]